MSALERPTAARDRWIPWYFVLFFAVISAVMATMVTLAVRTQSGIVTDHPYEKGLAYNRVIASAERQAALGWKGTATHTPTGERTGRLTFRLRDKAGAPVHVESVAVRIVRPTQAGHDFRATLLPITGDDYAAEVTYPLPGVWELHFHAVANGQPYQQSTRIVVR